MKRDQRHPYRGPQLKDYDLAQLSAHQLIDALDECYPRQNPNPSESHASIMHNAGMRALVEILIQRKEKEVNG